MSIKITSYNAVCNLGNDIDSVYENALSGNTQFFSVCNDLIRDDSVYVAKINLDLSVISDEKYNLRCNKVILKTLDKIKNNIDEAIKKYGADRIGIVGATTNSGVSEFEYTKNPKHYELSNPAEFMRDNLSLKGFYTTVSTACSSGIKAFSLARNLLNEKISDCVIIVCVDTIAKVPLYGFKSLGVLFDKPSLPFSKNRNGMNIGEACSIFVLERNADKGIEILGIGESSDIYHATTPDPCAKEAINAIKNALDDANILPEDVDYINAHGTGTIANDLMEAHAINYLFSDNTPVSSTKPLTGHCLGAAAGIETALCCKLLDDFRGKYYPNIYDGEYDEKLDKIKLVGKNDKYDKCKICMCNSFGFGGTNAILILGNKSEK